ncbi:MAG: DUF1036 domain-containing protein [Maricaulaceae bacterium]|nr:DUF1036 domain-containing protein [Maricaulaceae bacterium]
MKRICLAAAAVAIAVAGAPAPVAQAQQATVTIRVCNNTNEDALVAMSYMPVGEQNWLNRGWFRVSSRSCRDLDDTGNRHFYLYAEVAGDSDRGWGGDHSLCVEYPGPYRFYSRRDAVCTGAQELVGFRPLSANNPGVFTWNLNY